jgi:hypothetical protein
MFTCSQRRPVVISVAGRRVAPRIPKFRAGTHRLEVIRPIVKLAVDARVGEHRDDCNKYRPHIPHEGLEWKALRSFCPRRRRRTNMPLSAMLCSEATGICCVTEYRARARWQRMRRTSGCRQINYRRHEEWDEVTNGRGIEELLMDTSPALSVHSAELTVSNGQRRRRSKSRGYGINGVAPNHMDIG